MKHICAFCNQELSLSNNDDTQISHGICESCYNNIRASMGVNIREYLDMLKEPVFIVDSDVRVLSANHTASQLTGKTTNEMIGCLGGEVFECIHAEGHEGCGKTKFCSGCIIRNSVHATYSTGTDIIKKPITLTQCDHGNKKNVHFLLSTRKDKGIVLLELEPVN